MLFEAQRVYPFEEVIEMPFVPLLTFTQEVLRTERPDIGLVSTTLLDQGLQQLQAICRCFKGQCAAGAHEILYTGFGFESLRCVECRVRNGACRH